MASSRSSATSATKQSEMLSDVLAAHGLPATVSQLSNILALGGRTFEVLARMRSEELEALLKKGIAAGRVRLVSEGTYQSVGVTSEKLHQILESAQYAELANAIARALPIIGLQGEADSNRLDRDLRNAFYCGDAVLLNSTISVLHSSFPKERLDTKRFNFLFDESDEWLTNLSLPFLMCCAWKLVPVAILELRPIRPLVEKLYACASNFQAPAICQLIDYAILCSDWKQVKVLMELLPAGQAPRQTRVAWIRFITGNDSQSVSFYLDALEGVRRDMRNSEAWFKTIGGLFMIMAELRINEETTLISAASHIQSAVNEDTLFHSVYVLLEKVISSKMQTGLPPGNTAWSGEGPLLNIFLCLMQYWLTGTLTATQQLLLTRSADLARDGAYAWLAQECDELVLRLKNPESSSFHRHHDGPVKGLPFMLDCVLSQNSWLERLNRLNHHLAELPPRVPRRISWQINVESGENGVIVAKPMEQHPGSNGKWTRGRKYSAYRNIDFTQINANGNLPNTEYDLEAQDKFACQTLQAAEAMGAMEPAVRRQTWGQVMQSLIGHPRLYLETMDGRHLKCVDATPCLRLAMIDDQFQYRLHPSAVQGENIVVRLENGDLLCVYQFDKSLLELRELIGDEFRVPGEAIEEHAEILKAMIGRYQVCSEIPLDFLEVPAEIGDYVPYVRLTPESHGLKVQLLVAPFYRNRDYFAPGTGPREMIFHEHGKLHRLVRNFDIELQEARQLIEACPTWAAAEPDPDGEWSWSIEGLAGCEFTLQLHQVMDKCRIEWPEDRKFVCHRTLTQGNISLNTQTYQRWFSVEGEVHLEGTNATTTLGELIQAAVVDKKRFISLNDGQMVALSEGLRKSLHELSQLGEFTASRGGAQTLRISQFLRPFASEILSSFGNVEKNPDHEVWIQKYDKAMQETAEVPAALNITLRPYQKDGYTWLSRLDKIGAGACLADDMGLGKTLQAITLILSRAAEGPALVVAPTSLCNNWKNEFQSYAPTIKAEIFGPGDRAESFKRMKAGHVMITSYGLLQSELEAFKKIQWRVAVLDEAQAIKNSHAKRSQAALEINAQFRIVTTGTPVENNLNELWSIFNFTVPGLLGSSESFQRRFAQDKDEMATNHLKDIVSPFLLRRLKSQVLAELPPKEEIDYFIELSPEERKFYDDLRHQILSDLDAGAESSVIQRHSEVLKGITRLRLAVDHPSLVEGGTNLPGSKLEAFLELTKSVLANGHKILVFSQFVKFLSVVQEAFRKNEIGYQYLDGSMTAKERESAVKAFRNGESPVFLISLQAGGLGLNLTEADYVIHLDSWWNPAVENQASDRAHRLGQNKKVTVYHLRTVNTIEDKIRELHKKKLDLADKLLGGNDTIEDNTSMEELLRLLREP